jgi:putative transposase
VHLQDAEDVIDRITYVLANPVAARLVSCGKKWTGLRGYRPDDVRTIPRPTVFFRAEGPMPQTTRLQFSVPPALSQMTQAQYIARVAHSVAQAEARHRNAAAAEGRPFSGIARVLAQKPTDTPISIAPRRQMNPQVAARNKWRRIEALQRLRDFIRAYRAAHQRWKAGAWDVLFPAGTYALRVDAGARVADT